MTMAVEDIAKMSPMVSATGQGCPKSIATPITAAVVPMTWALPVPRMGPRSLQSRLGRSSKPTTKSIITTPNSAKCCTSSTCPTRFSKLGPMTMPAMR